MSLKNPGESLLVGKTRPEVYNFIPRLLSALPRLVLGFVPMRLHSLQQKCTILTTTALPSRGDLARNSLGNEKAPSPHQ